MHDAFARDPISEVHTEPLPRWSLDGGTKIAGRWADSGAVARTQRGRKLRDLRLGSGQDRGTIGARYKFDLSIWGALALCLSRYVCLVASGLRRRAGVGEVAQRAPVD